MQTFSDFINKRFTYRENNHNDSNSFQDNNNKNFQDLQKIINKILQNPNYQQEFVELVRNFVNEKIEDSQLKQMFSQFEKNVDINNINPDRGLASFDGEANVANNLPPNMGG